MTVISRLSSDLPRLAKGDHMKTDIKVLHTSTKRVSKSGKAYVKVLVLITIGNNEFIEVFYVYES